MDRALTHRLNRRSLMTRAGGVTAAVLTASIPTLTAHDAVRAAPRVALAVDASAKSGVAVRP